MGLLFHYYVFCHVRSRERAKYEAIIRPGLTGFQQGEYRQIQKELL